MRRGSVSSTYIKAFSQCLLKFYYKYYEKKNPVIVGEARAFGIAMHSALEEMYERIGNTGKKPTQEDYDFVYKVFLREGLKNNLADQSLYEEGKFLLKGRLDSYDPSEKIIGLEVKFGFPYNNPEISVSTSGGTPLIGAIDKLMELDSDTLVVADYKTSRTAMTDYEASRDAQLSLYDLAVSKLYPQYKNIIVVLDYLRLKPVITHRTEEQRSWFESYVDELYAEVGSLTDNDFKPRLNEFCGWCDYKNYCSAYKGAISDPDLLVKPFETLSDDEFTDEWVRFSHVRRAVDSYKRDLSMHLSNLSRDRGDSTIAGENYTLYRVQSSRVQYDTETVMNNIPREDFIRMSSVHKGALDKYLSNHPDLVDCITDTAKVSFASSFFKHKKTKSK